MDIILGFKAHSIIDACKIVVRVSVPFTGDDYCGKEKRPNTELAHNSPFASRRLNSPAGVAHKGLYFAKNSL
jgi:hypothetical protein